MNFTKSGLNLSLPRPLTTFHSGSPNKIGKKFQNHIPALISGLKKPGFRDPAHQ